MQMILRTHSRIAYILASVHRCLRLRAGQPAACWLAIPVCGLDGTSLRLGLTPCVAFRGTGGARKQRLFEGPLRALGGLWRRRPRTAGVPQGAAVCCGSAPVLRTDESPRPCCNLEARQMSAVRCACMARLSTKNDCFTKGASPPETQSLEDVAVAIYKHLGESQPPGENLAALPQLRGSPLRRRGTPRSPYSPFFFAFLLPSDLVRFASRDSSAVYNYFDRGQTGTTLMGRCKTHDNSAVTPVVPTPSLPLRQEGLAALPSARTPAPGSRLAGRPARRPARRPGLGGWLPSLPPRAAPLAPRAL